MKYLQQCKKINRKKNPNKYFFIYKQKCSLICIKSHHFNDFIRKSSCKTETQILTKNLKIIKCVLKKTIKDSEAIFHNKEYKCFPMQMTKKTHQN